MDLFFVSFDTFPCILIKVPVVVAVTTILDVSVTVGFGDWISY